MKIAVLLTCFNRVETTLKCLSHLFSSVGNDFSFSVYLVDDGSIDGTGRAVKAAYADVNVIFSDGGLYWNRGMHLAFSHALEASYDGYIFLNDDTLLNPGAIQTMIDTYFEIKSRLGEECIVVGSTFDSEGKTSYGGLECGSSFRRFRFGLVEPQDAPRRCSTMNGNCVLIPRQVVERVGNLDPVFAHSMGDIDYGLRARKLGFSLYVAPGFVGFCNGNAIKNTFKDMTLSRIRRFQLLTDKKSLPFKSWFYLTFRHGGLLAPFYFSWPYLKVLIK